MEWTAIDNRRSADASGGSGVQAGTLVTDQDVQTVITGNIGPNAHRILAAAGVEIFQAGNGTTVRDALGSPRGSSLSQVDSPTIAGHWAR